MFGCNVYGTSYECAGAPTRFYLAILIIVIICISVYTFCCIYTFLWLHIPSLNKFWAFLNRFQICNKSLHLIRNLCLAEEIGFVMISSILATKI